MSNCTPAEQMNFLTTSDGEEFLVTEALTTMSQTICDLIKDSCAEVNIELSTITGDILEMVIKYCDIHVFKQKRTKPCKTPDGSPIMLTEKEIENWDKEFINVDVKTVFDLGMASCYLHIPQLEDLASKKLDEELRKSLKNLFILEKITEELVKIAIDFS
ncbi:SKP1-like protein 4 [Carex littledalei]|uniref:SKP1-like protein 4 n=1 Tax=Carex littledalei TaxID=544730 RepID=A0A833VHQ3_9POAL|nr:SKP1-like protein 4 [Carex littledalei]